VIIIFYCLHLFMFFSYGINSIKPKNKFYGFKFILSLRDAPKSQANDRNPWSPIYWWTINPATRGINSTALKSFCPSGTHPKSQRDVRNTRPPIYWWAINPTTRGINSAALKSFCPSGTPPSLVLNETSETPDHQFIGGLH